MEAVIQEIYCRYWSVPFPERRVGDRAYQRTLVNGIAKSKVSMRTTPKHGVRRTISKLLTPRSSCFFGRELIEANKLPGQNNRHHYAPSKCRYRSWAYNFAFIKLSIRSTGEKGSRPISHVLGHLCSNFCVSMSCMYVCFMHAWARTYDDVRCSKELLRPALPAEVTIETTRA